MLAVEAWAQLGVVPADDARADPRARAASTSRRSHERERVTDHDVAAFVDVVQASVGQPAGAWVHYGLTSSDVVDTALALQMTRAVDRILEAASDARVGDRDAGAGVPRHADGRPHARHPRRADDLRLQARALGAAGAPRPRAAGAGPRRDRGRQAVGRGRDVLERRSRRRAVTCASTSGSCRCRPRRCSPRDRHAEVLYACASVGATIESFALEIRHLQRTEVREAEEPFREGEQKGSSAMPHKRNPIKSEQLSGLARVLRGNLQAALEDVALWHERDISHSSVERIIIPDSLMLAYYMIEQMTRLVEGLRVYPERMLRNLDASFGLVFSQPVLLALVESGRSRDDAYRIVQRNAMRAWQEERSFRELLVADPEVAATLDAARLDACFDLKRALANVGAYVRRARPHGGDAIAASRRGRRTTMGKPGALPHLYSGKVRELYEVAYDQLLIVASDRVSVFDVVLPDEIPDKGRVLTGAVAVLVRSDRRHRSQPRDLVRPHRLSRDRGRGRRAGDARARDATDPVGVRRAGLPVRRGLG